ncbi:MAG: hypothetical protein OSB65_03380 [Roseibacillus sp.]|nr:hypothetical protein [Roseibacillus sp.]
MTRLHPNFDPATIRANLALGVLPLFIDDREEAWPQFIAVK